jgi:hypothetical protein
LGIAFSLKLSRDEQSPISMSGTSQSEVATPFFYVANFPRLVLANSRSNGTM